MNDLIRVVRQMLCFIFEVDLFSVLHKYNFTPIYVFQAVKMCHSNIFWNKYYS